MSDTEEWRASPEDRTATGWRGVVVGFDGTDHARCAVRWAAAEAAVRGCPLHLVWVVVHRTPTVMSGWVPALVGPDERERDLLVAELVAEADTWRVAHPGLEVHTALHDGAPSIGLAEHAHLVGAEVVVVGSSSHSGVARGLLGSTGAELVRVANRLVVVVRDETPVQQAGIATGIAPVLALLDDQKKSARVLAAAFDIAGRHGAGVTVVHHVPHADPDQGMRGVRDQVDRVSRSYPGVPVRGVSITGDACQAVLDMSAEARLVVVGDRRYGLARRLLAGSQGRKVLHDARCSVAVVP